MITKSNKRIILSVALGLMISVFICQKAGVFNSFLSKKYEVDVQSSASQANPASTAEPNKAKATEEKIEKKDYKDGNSIISIVQSDKKEARDIDNDEIKTMVNEAIKLAGGFDSIIKDGQIVVIKPNLVQKHVDSTGQLFDKELNGATTDWRVTEAVASLARKYNPRGKIYVMEGSAGDMTKVTMEYLNYTKTNMPAVDEFIAIEEDSGAWGDTNSPNMIKTPLAGGLLHKEYFLNKKYATCDVLISIPCMKTNSGTVVSGSVKNVGIGSTPANIYGVDASNPGRTNMVSHKVTDGELDKWLYDYYMCKPVNFVVMDGLQGFQNGPVPIGKTNVYSDRMNMRLVMAGKDSVAMDSVEALIEGWDPQTIGYLNYLAKSGMGILDTSKITVTGNRVDQVRRDFNIRFSNLGGVKVLDKVGPKISIAKKEVSENKLTLSINAEEKTTKMEVYLNNRIIGIVTKPNISEISIDLGGVDKKTCQIKLCAYDRYLNYTEILTDLSLTINEQSFSINPVNTPMSTIGNTKPAYLTYFDRKSKFLSDKNIEGLMYMSLEVPPINPEKNSRYYELPRGIIRLAHENAMTAFEGKNSANAEKLTRYGLDEYVNTFIKKDLINLNINDITLGESDSLKDYKIPLGEFILIFNNYAYFIAQTGDDRKAEPYLRKVIELSPNRAVAYIDLGNVCWNIGKKEEAKEDYKKYLALLGKNTSKVPQFVYDRIKE